MLIEANLSEVEEMTPVPAGTYQARITAVEAKESKAGNPYLNWKSELIGEDVNGRIVFHTTPISGKGAFRLQELYRAATHEVLSKESPSFDTEQIIGKEVLMTLTYGVDQEGNPRQWPEVKSVAPIK